MGLGDGRFPLAASHDDVRCFRCGGETHSVTDTGYPPGSGQYRKSCSCLSCGVYTFYDVKKTEVLPQTRVNRLYNDRRS